jgi:hypothetical protein
MSNATDLLEGRLASWTFSAAAVTRPTAWHLALFTAAPTDAGGGTEVSGGAYARQSFTPSVSGSTVSLPAAVEWPAATANWGTVTHVAVMDAATAGNMLVYMALTPGQTINSGNIFRLTAITLTLD